MWETGLSYSKDSSVAMGTFVTVSEWLSKNLEQEEIAVVPSLDIFLVLNPELRDNFVDYQSIWDSANISFQERSSPETLLELHEYFNNFLEENPRVRYLVLDWVSPYARYIFEENYNLQTLVKEIKTIPFMLSTGWSSKITIYERVNYSPLLTMNFSLPPIDFHTIPSSLLVAYGLDGATIQKVDSRVGFYLPLEEPIDVTTQNYLEMQINMNLEEVDLLLVFYYDGNHDGMWSGYDYDYVQSVQFSKSDLGWISNKWYTIYQVIPEADDPVTQIGVILDGNAEGDFKILNFIVYTEVE